MRIGMAAVILGVILGTPLTVAEAQINRNTEHQYELPLEQNDTLQSDPFAIEWSLGLTGEEAQFSEETEGMSQEDSVIAKWKEKQKEKWAHLPSESFTINASAYTASKDECGKTNGITSSGVKAEEGRTIACPPEFPFGAKIYIEGVGERRCEDRGGAITGNHVDIFMSTKTQAFSFGRQNLQAHVVN